MFIRTCTVGKSVQRFWRLDGPLFKEKWRGCEDTESALSDLPALFFQEKTLIRYFRGFFCFKFWNFMGSKLQEKLLCAKCTCRHLPGYGLYKGVFKKHWKLHDRGKLCMDFKNIFNQSKCFSTNLLKYPPRSSPSHEDCVWVVL